MSRQTEGSNEATLKEGNRSSKRRAGCTNKDRTDGEKVDSIPKYGHYPIPGKRPVDEENPAALFSTHPSTILL